MRLALVQLAPRLLEVQANLKRALERMSAVTADIFLLPELYATGYTFADASELERTAEMAASGPTYDAFHRFARERGAYVCYGFAERLRVHFANSCNLVGPAGLVATYRKIHLFGRETLFFHPGGDPAPVLDLGFGKVGLMICFDWYFPELARSLALRGAELLLHPSNLVLPHCPQAMITRSLENHVFSATCDRVGVERNGDIEHTFIGTSQVVNPSGEVLTRLSRDQEGTAVVELDLAAARSKRVGEYNDLFADRKAALYC